MAPHLSYALDSSTSPLQVSRYLSKVSRCRDIWIEAYRNANFFRPPSPFLWQSAHDLEGALVPSFRVDRPKLGHHGSTAQMPRLRSREIRYSGKAFHVGLVFGRFLLVALSKEVRCYDMNLDAFDSKSDARINFRPTGGTLKYFHCVSAFDVEGHQSARVVLTEAAKEGKQLQMWALTFDAIQHSTLTTSLDCDGTT